MRDYKDRIQALAEERAWEKYDKAFYELTDAQQYEIYDGAIQDYVERYIP